MAGFVPAIHERAALPKAALLVCVCTPSRKTASVTYVTIIYSCRSGSVRVQAEGKIGKPIPPDLGHAADYAPLIRRTLAA
jgi:hypothetical protein